MSGLVWPTRVPVRQCLELQSHKRLARITKWYVQFADDPDISECGWSCVAKLILLQCCNLPVGPVSFKLQIGRPLPPNTKRSLSKRVEAAGPVGEGSYIQNTNYGTNYDFISYRTLPTEATTFVLSQEGYLQAPSSVDGTIEYAKTILSDAIRMLPSSQVSESNVPEICKIDPITRELTCDPTNSGLRKFYTCEANGYFNNNPLLGDYATRYPTSPNCQNAPWYAIPVPQIQLPELPRRRRM